MKSAMRITLIYAAVSAAWIVFSDKAILLLTSNAQLMTFYSSIKGLLFILVTGTILYLQIHREINVRNEAIRRLDAEAETREQLIRELHHRIKNNIQVVLSLINIEAGKRPELDEFRENINSKLISMMSVFNIVYDLRDLKSISFRQVLEEYARISVRNVSVGAGVEGDGYSIETIVTAMMLIDSVLDVLFRDRDFVGRVELANTAKGVIEIGCPEGMELDIGGEARDFIDLQLRSINGTMAVDEAGRKLRISFADT